MKKIFASLILTLFVFADADAASFKKYAGEFLYLGAGSRATAMGGAFSGISNDVTSVYWNPAGLTRANGLQIQFMHSKQFISSIQNNFLAASHPLDENSTIGVGLQYITVSGIKDSRRAYVESEGRIDPSRISLFNTGDYIFSFSYARRHNEDFRYGLSAKLLYRDYHVASATGIGFDAGAQYDWHDFTVAAVARDLTSTVIAWDTGETELLKPSLRLGLAYAFDLPQWKLAIRPAVDFNILGEERAYAAQYDLGLLSVDMMAGAEFEYAGILALRAGVDDLQRFTAGAGLSIPKMTFDYAFTGYENELGNIHRISFHLQLEEVF